MPNTPNTSEKKPLEARMVALRDAASFLNTSGGHTNIIIEHSGGSIASSWRASLRYSNGSGHTAEGRTDEEAFDKLQDTFMLVVREEENKFATRMGFVYSQLGIERAK